MDDLEDEDRKVIHDLVLRLSSVSQADLMQWQFDWQERDPLPSFEEFVVAQNLKIRELVKLETSDEGKVVRKSLGLEPLDLDEELDVEGRTIAGGA